MNKRLYALIQKKKIFFKVFFFFYKSIQSHSIFQTKYLHKHTPQYQIIYTLSFSYILELLQTKRKEKFSFQKRNFLFKNYFNQPKVYMCKVPKSKKTPQIKEVQAEFPKTASIFSTNLF